MKPSSSDGNKPKKGKQDGKETSHAGASSAFSQVPLLPTADAVPAVPPVMYYVEYEDLDGGAVGSFTAKKVEIDPQAVAEAEAKQASQSTAERPGSKGSSKPQGGAADNKVTPRRRRISSLRKRRFASRCPL